MEVGSGGQNVYGYDGAGLRVKAVANGGAPIYYVRSSVLGNVAMEVEGSQAILYRAYIYAGKSLIAQQSTDGQFYWVHKDHLGSASKLTNTSGVVLYRAEFDPFGQTVYESGTFNLNSKKFTGYERDWATGLDYANARMYTSRRGQFMQSDPIAYGCSNKNPDLLAGASKLLPQSLNRYGYVRQDPVNRYDPSGLLIAFPGDCVDVYLDGIFWFSTCGGGGFGGFGGGGGVGGGRSRGGEGETEDSCLFPLLGCLAGILGYARVLAELAVCPATGGLTCVLAFVEHVVLAVLIAKECPEAAKNCGRKLQRPRKVAPE